MDVRWRGFIHRNALPLSCCDSTVPLSPSTTAPTGQLRLEYGIVVLTPDRPSSRGSPWRQVESESAIRRSGYPDEFASWRETEVIPHCEMET